jgi:hypothetical protein
MSTVIGQVDIRASAVEIRRVLADGGRLLVREGFADRPWNPLIERYFPSVLEIAAARGVISGETISAFKGAGFVLDSLEGVEELWANSLADALERLRHRAGSLLALMSDEAWINGLGALEADAQIETEPHPIRSRHDLAVFSLKPAQT